MNTPVALILFNRPGQTERVMRRIAEVKPPKLFLIADGPRDSHPEDQAKCQKARSIAESLITWDCEVMRNFADENLGCGKRPASGISWVFEHVEEAIILEDDCVPHPSFFKFCQEMLERYRDDTRVMHVAGCTYRSDTPTLNHSYRFSCFNGAWGWATWRRAWKHFDLALKGWPELRNTSWLEDILGDEFAVQTWTKEFEVAWQKQGRVSYWDHQWSFACWANSGLSIVPGNNMVSNIGCGEEATHTFNPNNPAANLPVLEMKFPLNHPPFVLQDRALDRWFLHETIIPRFNRPPTPWRKFRQKAANATPPALRSFFVRLRDRALSPTDK